MKKYLINILFVMATICLMACGEKNTKETTEIEVDETITASVEETPTPLPEPEKEIKFGEDFDPEKAKFNYLHSEVVRTKIIENPQTGWLESDKLTVFLPEGDIQVDEGCVRVEQFGVEVHVCLEPKALETEDNLTLTEKMEKCLDYEFNLFDHPEYRDLVLSEIELGDDGAKATVEYLGTYNEDYAARLGTCYLVENDEELTALAIVLVKSESVTEETIPMLEELEKFYGDEIYWDAEWAQTKRDTYLQNGGDKKIPIAVGDLRFELSKGWYRVEGGNISPKMQVYMPNKELAKTECLIGIQSQKLTQDVDVEDVMDEQQATNEILESLFEGAGGNVSGMVTEEYGETCLGPTVRSRMTISLAGQSIKTDVYIAQKGEYQYYLIGVQISNSGTNVSEVIQKILKEGITRE